jgi:penicillin G amidase
MNQAKIYFLIHLCFTLLLLFILNHSWTIKGNKIPSIGAFTSPFHGFWQNAENSSYFNDIILQNTGVARPVEIIMDERLVPIIFAENSLDAAYAQGYLHAKYRLWQIDVSLRDISGRLSEVFGERTLERDLLTRRQGFVWAAEENLKKYQQSSLFNQIAKAYLDGFNQYVESLDYSSYPLEFKLLNYCPSKLDTLDLVLISKNLARTLTMAENDIANNHLIKSLGEEVFNDLFPLFQPNQSPVHPSNNESVTNSPKIPAIKYNDVGIDLFDYYQEKEQDESFSFASNNWATGPEKTKNGYPILCNDPHLNLTLPSIWYESAIITPEYKVRGVSLAGLPSIIIGFNEHIAWGVTNGGHDVLDWIAIEWEDTTNLTYRFGNEILKSTSRTETIKIKGKLDHTEEVIYTHWGPVAIRDTMNKKDFAMHWTGHYVMAEDEILVFQHLNEAKNLEDYLIAIQRFPAPIQNIVFASIQGDIALKSAGYWPLRKNHSGLFISDGSNPESSWSSPINNENLPLTINPNRQFVSSANQHSTNPDYPNIYFGKFDGYRGRILNRYLENNSNLNIDDMKKWQLSNYSLKAEEALPSMLSNIPRDKLDASQRNALVLMENWNMEYNPEMWQPVLFDVWYESAKKMTFDELDSENPLLIRMPEKWILSNLMNKEPNHTIFDIQLTKDKVENLSDILLISFLQAWEMSGLTKASKEITWNNHMKPAIHHLAKIPAFSVSTSNGGSKDALNAASFDNGPSWRMIVEMNENGPIGLGVYPGGQDGNPGSKYYDNMIEDWANGKYYNLSLPKDPSTIDSKIMRITLK